ncbi:hypothetical protein [Niastella populi]|uniref:Uncharacterized protein n=1 Tax=Niastella populi TaxID=550983 RepID=A0A1V9FNK8_9BACT|nr:hypothetical protein [Niastella populi]OQP59836.1 hypothetical protein A4R26_20845 [Niastella populi]
MKKGLLKKGLLVLAITAAIALTASKRMFAREVAEGCIYNWNSSAFCFSDNGFPVSHCSSGPTACEF